MKKTVQWNLEQTHSAYLDLSIYCASSQEDKVAFAASLVLSAFGLIKEVDATANMLMSLLSAAVLDPSALQATNNAVLSVYNNVCAELKKPSPRYNMAEMVLEYSAKQGVQYPVSIELTRWHSIDPPGWVS